MKPAKTILIEYDPITGARMIPMQNNINVTKQSQQEQTARAAFHNAAKFKNAIVSKPGVHIKHK